MAKHVETSAFEDRLDSLKESVRGLVDFSSERADKLKGKMLDVKDTVVASSRSGVNRLGEMIKDHPIAAIGIAFGLGYITIRMMRR
jgi:ElaB/YqjD/DUF883 family membrane-anchored ribosome-binding protein